MAAKEVKFSSDARENKRRVIIEPASLYWSALVCASFAL
jgi:hypothetical protein